MKAEGGWAVVCTEGADIHPSGDMSPLVEGRLRDDRAGVGAAAVS